MALVAASSVLLFSASLAIAAKPKVSIKDATVAEPELNGDTVKAVFRVKLSKESDGVVKVTYDTGSDTAGPGDYDADSGPVKIKAGKKSAKVKITVNGDDEVEGTEQFNVGIFEPKGAKIDRALAVGTITDSD